ncbi:MAG TPA: methylated-DNA--[protein]-cysteine S-methyltransferase [Flavisolibacter sp.]|nr:methylated-DNA--[protein]-cysteine S-methyltransferase [Flavisolibacter sp.]
MNLYTAYYPSPVGQLKLQASDRYIKSVLFAEENQMGSDHHKLLQSCARQLDEYFSGKRRSFNLPLNQDGTGFQMKVWDLLYKIPYGRTISYNELARQYGDVKAIRAVAAANGRNNLAIIVPCHRVIGSDHSLVGYGGGLWRKKWLLDHEARFYHGVQQFDFSNAVG